MTTEFEGIDVQALVLATNKIDGTWRCDHEDGDFSWGYKGVSQLAEEIIPAVLAQLQAQGRLITGDVKRETQYAQNPKSPLDNCCPVVIGRQLSTVHYVRQAIFTPWVPVGDTEDQEAEDG